MNIYIYIFSHIYVVFKSRVIPAIFLVNFPLPQSAVQHMQGLSSGVEVVRVVLHNNARHLGYKDRAVRSAFSAGAPLSKPHCAWCHRVVGRRSLSPFVAE